MNLSLNRILNSVDLPTSFLVILLVTALFLSTLIQSSAQNNTANSDNSSIQVINELRQIKASIIEESSSALWSDIRDTIWNILGVVVPVVIALYVPRLSQEIRRKNTIQRSCVTLLRELGQARLQPGRREGGRKRTRTRR